MLTVVWIETDEMSGCWMNCVNGTGWPWAPPSNTGVMNVVIGNSAVVGGAMLTRNGVSDMRTKRRSPETTAWMVRLDWPVDTRLFCGLNTSCPFDWKTF